MSLDIASLRYDDHLCSGVIGQRLSDQLFGSAVSIVCAGVDEISAEVQIMTQRGFMLGMAVDNAIASESEGVAV